jgi:hypothetical protein
MYQLPELSTCEKKLKVKEMQFEQNLIQTQSKYSSWNFFTVFLYFLFRILQKINCCKFNNQHRYANVSHEIFFYAFTFFSTWRYIFNKRNSGCSLPLVSAADISL